MKINAQTRISAIINHNKEAIEVIAKINPHFKKLKNPILRKVLAPRVNIADAARIGNCEVFDFLSALATIGFEIETDTVYSEPTAQPEATKQENLSISEAVEAGKFKSLDVRPILSQGTDPFKHIMDEIKELPDGVVLEVVNTFEPTPLIKILNNKGYASLVKTDGGVVKTYFMNAVEEIAQKTDGVERIFYVNLDALEDEKA